MRLLASFLCDAASVRENLGHVLGAGIRTIEPQQYPVTLAADFFVLLEIEEPVGSGQVVEVSLDLRKSDASEPIGGIGGTLELPAAQSSQPRIVNVPLALPLRFLTVTEPGKYELVLTLPGLDDTIVPVTLAPAREEKA